MSAVLNPARMPGYGDTATWGGARPDAGYDRDDVGDPEREIRDAFDGDLRGTVPLVTYKGPRSYEEITETVEQALREAVENVPEIGTDLTRLLTGDITAAARIRQAAADYWVKQNADEVLMYRSGELDDAPEDDDFTFDEDSLS